MPLILHSFQFLPPGGTPSVQNVPVRWDGEPFGESDVVSNDTGIVYEEFTVLYLAGDHGTYGDVGIFGLGHLEAPLVDHPGDHRPGEFHRVLNVA